MATRNEILLMSDEEIIKFCTLDFFKASGNGGQKRNKCSTAVRIMLEFEGENFVAGDCTERSQHQNRHKAIKKLKRKIAYKIRNSSDLIKEYLYVSEKNSRYYLYLAQLIDVIYYYDYDLKQAAESIGISHSKLDRELRKDSNLFQEIQNQTNLSKK